MQFYWAADSAAAVQLTTASPLAKDIPGIYVRHSAVGFRRDRDPRLLVMQALHQGDTYWFISPSVYIVESRVIHPDPVMSSPCLPPVDGYRLLEGGKQGLSLGFEGTLSL